MNQRIRQLAKKAGIEMYHDKVLPIGYLHGNTKNFAELIILDMIKAIEEQISFSDSDTDYDIGIIRGMEKSICFIEKHFNIRGQDEQ